MNSTFLKICGGLVALRSLTNFVKLFQGDEAILVFFGQVLRGPDVTLPSILVGSFMLVTGVTLLVRHALAPPLITVYAGYVLLNMSLWTLWNPGEMAHVGGLLSGATDSAEQLRYGRMGMMLYAAIALSTTALPAWMLHRGANRSA